MPFISSAEAIIGSIAGSKILIYMNCSTENCVFLLGNVLSFLFAETFRVFFSSIKVSHDKDQVNLCYEVAKHF